MNKIKMKLCIFFSLGVALILMIVPIPQHWQWLRPEWVALMLVFWVFREPDCLGIMTGWCVGLLMDILGGVILGQYALAMSIMVYLAQLLRNRLRLFPFWQQTFVVLILVGLGQLVLLLTQWLIGNPPRTLLYWGSTVSSVLLWPILYHVMQFYARRMVIR